MNSIAHPESRWPSRLQPVAPPRVAVLYDSGAGVSVYDIAVEIAARAWDAGATVRVRRIGALDDSGAEGCGEEGDVPLAEREDVEWASVTLVLARLADRRLAPTTLA